jgi:hypothetical protein
MTMWGMHLYTNPHALQDRKPLLQAHHRHYKFHHDDIIAADPPTSMFDVQQFLAHMNSPASAGVERPSRSPLQRCKRSRKNSMWTDSQLKAALAAIDDGQSMQKADQEHNIPCLSLRDWCCGKTRSRIHRAKEVLTASKESELVTYLTEMYDRGYGLSLRALKMKVYEITKTRWTPFRNGILGARWMHWFKGQVWQCNHGHG